MRERGAGCNPSLALRVNKITAYVFGQESNKIHLLAIFSCRWWTSQLTVSPSPGGIPRKNANARLSLPNSDPSAGWFAGPIGQVDVPQVVITTGRGPDSADPLKGLPVDNK